MVFNMNRVCKKCNIEKNIEDFARNGGRYRTICKSCDSERVKQKILITVAYVQTLKDHCSICGYSKDKSALEFHHTDESDKLFNIGSFACSRIWSIKTKQLIDAEIKKCICLCANCHRELHSKQISEETIKNIDFSFNIKSKRQLALESLEYHNRKFTKQDILDIRNKYNSGISYNDLSSIYNCCRKTIWRIVHYITYKHI